MDTRLELGAQRRAAETVQSTIGPISKTLTELRDGVVGASGGFKGSAAGALGEALQEWFEVAGRLGPTLIEYSQKLAAVDQRSGANDEVQRQVYERMKGQLR